MNLVEMGFCPCIEHFFLSDPDKGLCTVWYVRMSDNEDEEGNEELSTEYQTTIHAHIRGQVGPA